MLSAQVDDVTLPLVFDIEELGERTPYPKFERTNEFCELFTTLNRDVFDPLGVEFGMRTIRQGLNYVSLFSDVNDWPSTTLSFIRCYQNSHLMVISK